MAVPFEQHVILLVDDEASSRFLVGQMLRRMGFAEVLFAESGQRAVTMLNALPAITAVITDFRMPGLHGLQLLKMIRTGATAAPRNLTCAMLTSYAERHLVGLAIVLDVDTFLAKPVSLETLTKHLTRCFQYRFEPLEVTAYAQVEVDNAAPHLIDPFTPQAKVPAPEEKTPSVEDKTEFFQVPGPRAAPEPETEARPEPPAAKPAAPAREAASKPSSKTDPERTPRSNVRAAPAPDKAEASARKPVATPPAPEKDEKPSKKVALADVPEGAILARDVVGANGTLLLSAGMAFKARYAKRLDELGSFSGKVEHVWIVNE
jgi:CheY-like chemotaxis protein